MANQVSDICAAPHPKEITGHTWAWNPKDSDYRTLPLTDELVSLLAEHQSKQSEKYPYVFVPPLRYDRIQRLRDQGKWKSTDARLKVINNFTKQFKRILKLANIKHGRSHNLRCTALSTMLAQGLSKYDLMKIAGHSKFETTEEFYLSVQDDLVGRARNAVSQGFGSVLARAWHTPYSGELNEKS